MNIKLFKKALTAVLTAALLLTSNGIASLNASAAEGEKILVKGVYTNFQKATMATQTTRQINAYVEPEDATVQNFKYISSAPEVAKVSSTGLITALSSGKATITVTALDGSKQYETIEITVLNDLTITNKYVDSDNEVIVLDKTIGNLYIDSSVGDADIYLGGVTVRNILAMDSGDYSLYLYDSTAKELKIDEIAGEIESFAADEEEAKAPNLILGEKTTIKDLNARISASIRQEDGSVIEGLRVTQSEDGRITVYLENYSGGLLLDSSLGDLELVTTGCKLSNVDVNGDENAGSIQLTDGGNSEIESLTLSGAANLSLAVPTNEVNIHIRANGASFSSSSSIGTLRDAGVASNVSISGEVGSLEANGDNARINVAAGGYVGTANLNREGLTLYGAGEVSEAYVNANNISVDTVNTLLTVGDVTGTKSQGEAIIGGSTVATKAPVGSGGGGSISIRPPEPPLKAGDIILDNNFENRKNDLNFRHGEVETMTIIDGGNDSTKALKVSGRNQTYHGVGYDFSRYLKKRATVRIKFDIKCAVAPESGDGKELKATMKTSGTDSNYHTVASIDSGNANTWYTLEGTFELANNINSAQLYIEAPGTYDYYLDNVLITVDRIGDPIPVTGISIDPASLDTDGTITIDINELKILTAIVTPDTADNTSVTWQSADPTIATVEAGVVKGIATGSTSITAKTVDGNFTAEVDVTVTDQVLEETPASENFENIDVGTILDWLGYGGEDGEATVIEDPANPFNKLLEVKPSGYNRAPIINIILPEGNTLADYSHIKYKALWKSGDIGWKDILVEADGTLSGTLGDTGRQIASYNRSAGATTILEENELELNGNKGSLEGAIQIAIGINCAGTGNDEPTVYYLDDIELVLDTTVPTPITGITLEPSSLTMAQGENAQLTATIEPEEFTTSGVITWTSGDENVATVDANGKVTAVGAGNTIITATTARDGVSEDIFTAECNVGVTSEVAFKLNRSHVVLATISDTVMLTPSTGTDITWGTSDPAIATVMDGTVTAVADGTVTITATNNDTNIDATCIVEVNTKAIFIEDFEDNAIDELLVNDYATLTVSNEEAYDGQYGLLLVAGNQYNGIQYVFTNSSDTEKVYNVSAYVKNAQPGTTTIMLWQTGDPYTTYADNTAVGSAWVELNTANNSEDIRVPAGGTVTARFKSNGAAEFYIDNIVITDVTPSSSETVTLTDSSSPTYGVSFNGTPITGLTIDSVSNVVSVSGSSITASNYKVASVYLDESYIGKTISVTAKVRRTGNVGALGWQMNSGGINVAVKWSAPVDEWFTISGSAEVTQAGELYMTTYEGTSETVYYIADLVITSTGP